MQNTQKANEIYTAIQRKMDAIASATAIREWRFCIGAPEKAIAPGFDDREWEKVHLIHTWSCADGEAWFRTMLDLPSEVEGIPLAGSGLEVEIFLTTGAVIYVNGEEKYRDRWWADTRGVPLTLTEEYEPGTLYSLVVRCNAGDGFGAFIWAIPRVSRLAETVFELDLIRAQMAFTRFLADESSEMNEAKVSAWEGAASALDLRALEMNEWDSWWASVEAARAELAPFAEEAKTYTAHLIAHAHIDMNWVWPWSETVEVCRRDFSTMDQLMEKYPEFHFSQSQAAAYHAMEAYHPEVFERIRARVAEGRWDITATNWVEGDLNMASGEAQVRQILYTRPYIAERFGVEPVVCWEPDTFGHPATYPQILKKSGIQFYYFCRAGKGHPLFWWEGLDGSRVLAVQDVRGYGGVINPWGVVEAVMDFGRRYGVHHGIKVYGVCDHGGGATARDLEAARVIDAAPFLPRAHPNSTVDFYQKVLEESPQLPLVRGELNTVFEGCYTSHGDIKRLNRDGENSLLTAETLATLATVLMGAPYPQDELTEAWRTLCFHQFHDILCGCAIGLTYREARERMSDMLQLARRITTDALTTLTTSPPHHLTTSPPCLVVFNPLAWERTDIVRVPLQAFNGGVPVALEDEVGRRLPVQVCGEELVFIAESVPSLGMRVYRPIDVSVAADFTSAPVQADGEHNVLDNGLLRLRVHPASGAIDQLIDQEAGRDLAGPWVGWGPEAKVNAGMLNRLQILWEQPHPMSAWNLGDITRVDHLITGAEGKVVESGLVRGVIEVRRRFLNSALVQRIVLYRGLRRIDFETEIDWHERGGAHHDAPMLRATFSPYLEQTRATFETAFGAVERPADGREVPALRWADLSEKAYGVSLLNDGKYGHQAHGNTLGLTLVRASYEPDNNPDEGLHRFTYSLYPHRGTWKEAGTLRRAAELNQPLLAVVRNAGTQGRGDAERQGDKETRRQGDHSPRQAWLQVDSEAAVVTAVKRAEEQPESGYAVIVRLFESHGQPVTTALRTAFPLVRAEEVDLMERRIGDLELTDEAIQLTLSPHEIKTVKLYTASCFHRI